jgi:hypothetical protein
MESRTQHPRLETKETFYRSIIHLPTASEAFGNLLSQCLLLMAEFNGLLPNHQFGFRQRHSTLEQTQRIVRRINEVVEKKKSNIVFQNF